VEFPSLSGEFVREENYAAARLGLASPRFPVARNVNAFPRAIAAMLVANSGDLDISALCAIRSGQNVRVVRI